MMRKRSVWAGALLLVFVLGGCAVKPVEEPTSFTEMSPSRSHGISQQVGPGVDQKGTWAKLLPGIERSLAYMRYREDDAVAVERPGLRVTWGEVRQSLQLLKRLLPRLKNDPALLSRHFRWLRLSPQPLVTGYYEPWIEASLTPDPDYPYPLYGLPDDLKSVDLGRFHPRWDGQRLIYRMTEDGIAPYHDRESIDYDGALKEKSTPIAWAADPVDVFFLQIQGSGRLVLPGGSVKHILYAGKNGRQYVSLGKELVRRGHMQLENVSMQSIRAFLERRPELVQELLSTNPSYVFFRLADDGPVGSMGRALTPYVSCAVDRTVFPLGGLVVMDTLLPTADGGEREATGLLLAQDTGGAIKEARLDLFCGSGPEGAYLAGHMKNRAELYLLLPRR